MRGSGRTLVPKYPTSGSIPPCWRGTVAKPANKTAKKGNTPASAGKREVARVLAEIGRKGGSRKTERQQAVLQKTRNASSTVRSAQALGRLAQIQALKEAGYTQKVVAEKWVWASLLLSEAGNSPKVSFVKLNQGITVPRHRPPRLSRLSRPPPDRQRRAPQLPPTRPPTQSSKTHFLPTAANHRNPQPLRGSLPLLP